MMIEKIKDDIFGNLLKIENENFELRVSLDYGPRILHFSKKGFENIFYNDKDLNPLADMFDVYDGEILKLRGGHRLWASPEFTPGCYYPDNFPVTFEHNDNKFMFISPVEKFTNLQKIIKIEVKDNKVKLKHSIYNKGAFSTKIAPWAITMLSGGGVEIFPQSKKKTGYLHNRNFSFWDYADMTDERFYLGKEFVSLKQDVESKCAFKLGCNNEDGWAMYFNKNQVFIKKFKFDDDETYPDGGCNFETYTNDSMLEIETLGGLRNLEPNEKVSLKETWEIYEETETPILRNEEDYNRLTSKYLD